MLHFCLFMLSTFDSPFIWRIKWCGHWMMSRRSAAKMLAAASIWSDLMRKRAERTEMISQNYILARSDILYTCSRALIGWALLHQVSLNLTSSHTIWDDYLLFMSFRILYVHWLEMTLSQFYHVQLLEVKSVFPHEVKFLKTQWLQLLVKNTTSLIEYGLWRSSVVLLHIE